MSPFDHADASLASGPPFLAVAEPALLLFAFALGAFGGAIGNADALDALCLHRHLVLVGEECGICRHQARSATEPCLMLPAQERAARLLRGGDLFRDDAGH